MRVVAGRYGGRRLQAPPGSSTRPTADRVREALFSSLGPLDGARVLDLFAGSGALGIEAASRGAREVVFVERDRRALGALRANLEALRLEADVRPGDALRALKTARERAESYDLILVDPPYRLAAGLGRELSESLPPVLAPGARVVTESDRRSPVELTSLTQTFARRYGDTLIQIHA